MNLHHYSLYTSLSWSYLYHASCTHLFLNPRPPAWQPYAFTSPPTYRCYHPLNFISCYTCECAPCRNWKRRLYIGLNQRPTVYNGSDHTTEPYGPADELGIDYPPEFRLGKLKKQLMYFNRLIIMITPWFCDADIYTERRSYWLWLSPPCIRGENYLKTTKKNFSASRNIKEDSQDQLLSLPDINQLQTQTLLHTTVAALFLTAKTQIAADSDRVML